MIFRKRHPPTGATPGTLVIPEKAKRPTIRVMRYTEDTLRDREVREVEEIKPCLAEGGVTWVDVQGLGDRETLQAIRELFSIHPLAMEDVVNVPQRPKTEAYDEHQFFVARAITLQNGARLDAEQVSIFIGSNYVLTFQERLGQVFDCVRDRVRRCGGRIRKHGPDYLGYAIIDAAIDGYFPVVEYVGDQIESLEHALLERPDPDALQKIQRLRRDVLALRRVIVPQREAVRTLIRDDTPMVSDAVCVYLRDVDDHCVQLADVLQAYRDMSTSLMDMYLSSLGHRQNEIMKVLTIMASIFIPLTFMAGIYGMNFDNMPELKIGWAYPALIVLMALVAVTMILYFRRKGWIGRSRDKATKERP
jgi:magnesium transporter